MRVLCSVECVINQIIRIIRKNQVRFDEANWDLLEFEKIEKLVVFRRFFKTCRGFLKPVKKLN